MAGDYRKSVGVPARTNAGGGVAADAMPSGDHRLATQIRNAWGKAAPNSGIQAQNLLYEDAKSALHAIANKQVDAANANQIAANLGLVSDPMDVSPRQAMELLQKSAKGEQVLVDDHKSLIKEAEAALEAIGLEEGDDRSEEKKAKLSPEEWRAQAAHRRKSIKKDQQKKSLRLIPARSTSPDAVTGNGLNEPDQGAGKEVVDGAERNKQTNHTQRSTDTWQTSNDIEPVPDGMNAPSRHARIEALKRQLAEAEREAAAADSLEGLLGRLANASLSPEQIGDLHTYLDEMQKNDLYSEGQLDSVVSGPTEPLAEVDISEDDITGYLQRTGRHT